MPSLKDLSCSIELSGDQQPLQEFGTVYGDALVETFISIPKKQQAFTIHLSSQNFIAQGIAMYVFIDGIYQCNRNKQNLKPRQPPDRRSLVDFRARQKEERQEDGSMIAQEWTLDQLGHAPTDSSSPKIFQNNGSIEVIVLRCAGSRNTITPANMNLDGATDYTGHHSDRDRRSRTTAWDDRGPFFSVGNNGHGPPPPLPAYRSPYAETLRSHPGTTTQYQRGREISPFAPTRAYSRFSEPVSSGTRPRRDIPAPGFQYGSGPLPPETHRELVDEAIPAPTVDPALLEKIVTDAVKRGVEQSRRQDEPNGSRKDSGRYEHDIENSSQVPGAWPTSPTRPKDRQSQRSAVSANYNRKHDHDSKQERHSRGQNNYPNRSRAETRVAWGEEIGWDKQSQVDKWDSADENPADSWDMEKLWPKRPPSDWEEVHFRSRSRASPRRPFHASNGISSQRRSNHGHSQKSRSRPRTQVPQWPQGTRSSSEDNDGWTHIEALSDSTTSLERSDSTLKPSHSRSQVHRSRNKSARQYPNRHAHERAPPQFPPTPHWHPEPAYSAPPPSILVTNAPNPPLRPTTVQSQQQSMYTTPIAAPPPTWGCASETPRKPSIAATYLAPAPFSAVGGNGAGGWESSGSSSWGVPRKEKGTRGRSSWGGDEKVKKDGDSWGDVGEGDEWGEPREPRETGSSWGNGSGGTKQASEGWWTDNHDKNDDNKTRNPSSKPHRPRAWNPTARSLLHRHANDALRLPGKATPNPTSIPTPYHFPNATTDANTSPNPAPSPPPKAIPKATPYDHPIHRPQYLDTPASPYAIFRFKYRDREVLDKMGVFGKNKKGDGRGEEGTGWTEEWVKRYL